MIESYRVEWRRVEDAVRESIAAEGNANAALHRMWVSAAEWGEGLSDFGKRVVAELERRIDAENHAGLMEEAMIDARYAAEDNPAERAYVEAAFAA